MPWTAKNRYCKRRATGREGRLEEMGYNNLTTFSLEGSRKTGHEVKSF